MRTSFVVAAILCALTSCQNQRSFYTWGSYEQSVRELTRPDGVPDVDAQIQVLSQQIERTRLENGRIPPGLHAHVGFLYSLRGDFDTAQAAFESERELFPESAAFIDGVIERMGGK